VSRHKSYIVISYYTDNWEYADRAEILKKDCEQFRLLNDIVRLDDQGSWIDNTRLKARFVHEKLEEHKRPVLWIDADSHILRSPASISPYADFAAVRAKPPSTKTWYAGTLFFNYTDAGRSIARSWADRAIKGSDHMALETLWSDGFTGIIHSLPESFCETRPEKSDSAVILTGNSKDLSKQEYFRKNGTPRRMKRRRR
jgi:hypothetical protein